MNKQRMDPNPAGANFEVDLAIVGAGPAGLAAARAAGSRGLTVLILDEGFRAGGQIWRHRPESEPPEATRLLSALKTMQVQVCSQVSVFDGWREDGSWRLRASCPEGRIEVKAGRMVLACGAREQFSPFPGWTLPGVMGAGAGQALLKEGLHIAGAPVLVAGSGPMLLQVAATTLEHGGALKGVLEQAPWHRLLGMVPLLATSPGKAIQAIRLGVATLGTPYRPGWWVAEALGSEHLERVRITNGTRDEISPCTWLFCGLGLSPNLELGRLLGCEMRAGVLSVDDAQATSQPGVYAAGEICGVAGVDAALVEGEIAGLAASAAWAPSDRTCTRLARIRSKARKVGQQLEQIFALREELLALPQPSTTICRCEDVPLSAIDRAWGARETKLCTRAGMGPCQGRVCGPILASHFGHEPDHVRIPIKNVPLKELL